MGGGRCLLVLVIGVSPFVGSMTERGRDRGGDGAFWLVRVWL